MSCKLLQWFPNYLKLNKKIKIQANDDSFMSLRYAEFGVIMSKLKLTNAKLKSVAVFTAMMLASPTSSALGLGSLEVQSNLDQPFDGAIELRVAPGDDLGSVVATIASEEDFNNLNIDYPDYLSDMRLTVDSVNGDNVLRISSNGRGYQRAIHSLFGTCQLVRR